MTLLVLHLVINGVLLAPFVDFVRHKFAGGRALFYGQPAWRAYLQATSRYTGRPPLDAALVVLLGYGVLLLAAGTVPWRLHLLFALLLMASLMPPLYLISEAGVLILRPRIPWRRELSPWQFPWSAVERAQVVDEGLLLRVRPAPGQRAHLRFIPIDDPRDLQALLDKLPLTGDSRLTLVGDGSVAEAKELASPGRMER